MENETGSVNVKAGGPGSGIEQALPSTGAKPSYYRFENFELDCDRRELRRDGMKIWLKGKAFTLLVLLVEQGGKLITRDEIRAHIWSPDTHVDFDSSVATTLRKIRNALGDSGKDSKFIETRHGLGYRFMPRVFAFESKAPEATIVPVDAPIKHRATLPTQSETGSRETVPRESPRAVPDHFQHQRVFVRALITVGFLIAFSSSYALFRFAPRTAQASHPSSIVVLPFSVAETPPVDSFADQLRDELITRLAHIKDSELGIISSTTSMHYKHTDKSVREIARELNVNYLLEGELHKFNGQTWIVVRLVRARDQSVVWIKNYDQLEEGLVGLWAGNMAKEIADALSLQRGRKIA